VHPLDLKARRDGHLRRGATFRLHHFVWAALHEAVEATWKSRVGLSMTSSSLVEFVLTEWLVARGYLQWRWLTGEVNLPEAVWKTWERHEAIREGKGYR